MQRLRLTHDSTAVVTGAARGIGRAVAAELARRGTRVEGWDLRAVPTDEGVRSTRVDVSDARAVAGAGRRLDDRIDLVVHAAGISAIGSLAATDPGVSERVLRTNLLGPMLVTRALLPRLREDAAQIVFLLGAFAIAADGAAADSPLRDREHALLQRRGASAGPVARRLVDAAVRRRRVAVLDRSVRLAASLGLVRAGPRARLARAAWRRLLG